MSNISLEFEGPVATIDLARPDKLNALTPEMLTMLASLIAEAESRVGCRAIILAGAGKAFCAGADVRIWSALGPEDFRKSWIAAGQRCFEVIAASRLPVIAALHGIAFGGGWELALAADLRIAETGTRFRLPETSLGTVPGWGGMRRLAEATGTARAKHLVLTADEIDAETALAWGLVTKVVPEGEIRASALDLAQRVANLAPIAVQVAKSVVDGMAGHRTDWTLELLAGMVTASTTDVKEGTQAMLERRRPLFRES